ncbi:MAG: hypothetical protein ACLQNE_33395 [Thermoguttaceae bacterium]
MPKLARWAVCFAVLLGAAPVPAAVQDDCKQLLANVRHIPVIGAPGTVVPTGPQAFALVVGESGRGSLAPVVAATRWGKGRIVAFGHDGYFGKPEGDTAQLLVNAVRWAAGPRAAKSGPHVAVCNKKDLLAALQERKIAAIAADGKTWRVPLQFCHVFCVDTSCFRCT